MVALRRQGALQVVGFMGLRLCLERSSWRKCRPAATGRVTGAMTHASPTAGADVRASFSEARGWAQDVGLAWAWEYSEALRQHLSGVCVPPYSDRRSIDGDRGR